jgi:hypothetical protein
LEEKNENLIQLTEINSKANRKSHELEATLIKFDDICTLKMIGYQKSQEALVEMTKQLSLFQHKCAKLEADLKDTSNFKPLNFTLSDGVSFNQNFLDITEIPNELANITMSNSSLYKLDPDEALSSKDNLNNEHLTNSKKNRKRSTTEMNTSEREAKKKTSNSEIVSFFIVFF